MSCRCFRPRLVDVFDHADDSLELLDCALKLPVEHPPVAHHHYRIEDRVVLFVMQRGELMR